MTAHVGRHAPHIGRVPDGPVGGLDTKRHGLRVGVMEHFERRKPEAADISRFVANQLAPTGHIVGPGLTGGGRRMHRDPMSPGQKAGTSGVIAMGMGNGHPSDPFRRHLELSQPPGHLAIAQPPVDQDPPSTILEKRRVSRTSAPKHRQPDADGSPPSLPRASPLGPALGQRR